MSSANVEKHKRLVERLHSRVLLKTIEWTPDEFEPEIMQTNINGYVVELRRGNNENGEPLIILVIRDSDGKAIESFSDEDLIGEATSNSEYSSYWSMMDDLLTRATRQASGADKAIDDILEFLEDIPF